MRFQWVQFQARTDARGTLVPMEAGQDVPFAIERVYAIVRPVAGWVRGAHAHRRLRQVIVCLAGSCRITLDDGRETATAMLDEPARGLLLEPMVWHELEGFSEDCVLLVLADSHYDPADYISDGKEFREAVAKSWEIRGT